MKSKLKTIRQSVLIDANPDDVYQAYIEPEKHAAFTGSPATGTPTVGCRFTAWDGYIEGRYLNLERGKKIVHEWRTTDWPVGYPPSVVALDLKLEGKKTKLTMVHSRVPANQASGYAEGWMEFYWVPLRKYFGKARNHRRPPGKRPPPKLDRTS